MTTSKVNIAKMLPIMMAFFVMSFCDLVGIGVDRVKSDFNLSNTMAQLIPLAVFLWFAFLSVPIGILQDRIGKRNVLNLGMIVTAIGLLLPFLIYDFTIILIGFGLLGIGNTIVQVSANPLLIDEVPSEKKSSFLSFSQFIKAIGSMIAPPLTGWLAAQYGDWKLIFLVFGVVSILTVLWLGSTKIEETKNTEARASVVSSLKLLINPYIAMMVMSIFLIVGIDVGMNSVSGQFLLNKYQVSDAFALSGRSVYFFGKMLGTFGGALMLTLLPSRKFFFWSAVLAIASILGLLVAPNEMIALIVLFIIGLGVSNIFPLVFSLTVERYPNRTNEISGLMIMAVSGGIIPWIIGIVTDVSDNVTVGMFVFLLCAVYILISALANLKKS